MLPVTVTGTAQTLRYSIFQQGLLWLPLVALLATLAFRTAVDLKDIHTEGITAITQQDVENAVELGYRIKLLAIAKVRDGALEVRVHPTGSVSVLTGTHSHGQGHETTFPQVVADTLGIPMESVEIVHGDTDKIPYGMGTYGSRSIAVGGSAIVKAMDKVIAKGRKIAAHLLEAAEEDLEWENGAFHVKSRFGIKLRQASESCSRS